MKKKILALVVSSVVGYANAQFSLEELGNKLATQEGHDELKSMSLIQHGYTFTKIPPKYYIEKKYKYKRVGILSIMLNQEVTQEASITEKAFLTGTIKKTFQLPPTGLKTLASTIAPQVEAGLKSEGQKLGIEILTPEEYLISDDLIEEYMAITLEKGKMVQAKFIESSIGYRSFPKLAYSAVPGLGGVTYGSYYEIGLLAKKCGLDAMIMVVINGYPTIYKDNTRKFLFSRMYFHNMIVNQTPFKEGFKYAKLLGGYAALNGGGQILLAAGGAPIMEFKGGKTEIVDEGWSWSGLSMRNTKSYKLPDLALDADYTNDLGLVSARFSRFYLDQVLAYVSYTNERNELE
ncbi:MAG: hypothetical protein AAF616_01895 [Bacteroidota bacterium]